MNLQTVRMLNMVRAIVSVLTIGIALIILFRGVLLVGDVPTKSMCPNVMDKSNVIVNRLAYAVRKPCRGDIVSVKRDGKFIIKRIVGLPGDHIELIQGEVFVNGMKFTEPYLEANDITFSSVTVYDVPEDCYLLFGDNRSISDDARKWAESGEDCYIPKKDIVGRAFLGYSTRDQYLRYYSRFTEQ